MLDSLNSRYYVAVSGVKHGFFEPVSMSDNLQFAVVRDVSDKLKFGGPSESVPCARANHSTRPRQRP